MPYDTEQPKRAHKPIGKKTKPKQTAENTPIDWINSAYDPVQAERSMWVAVITQAMMDALSKSRKPDEQFCKFEAKRWLTSNSGHFRNVCALAGMDPDYVRAKAKKALQENTSWRAEAGTGKRYEERKAYRERVKALSPRPGAATIPPVLPLHPVMISVPRESCPL